MNFCHLNTEKNSCKKSKFPESAAGTGFANGVAEKLKSLTIKKRRKQ
jgi:hypothetical protein